MSTWVGIEAWEDEERQRDGNWQDAWDQLDSEQEPPDPDECPACDGQGCLVCCSVPARPEGGERDGQ